MSTIISKNDVLISEIKLANNGYLVMTSMFPSMRQTAIEMEKNKRVVITNGLVHLPQNKPEFFKSEYPKIAFQVSVIGPDYEAMILDRQADDGLYD